MPNARYCPSCKGALDIPPMYEMIKCKWCNSRFPTEYSMSYRQATETPEQAEARRQEREARYEAEEAARKQAKQDRKQLRKQKRARLISKLLLQN